MDRFLLFLIILLFIIFSVGCSAAPTAVRPSVTLDLPVATASFTAVKPSPTPTRVPVITATLAFARPTAPAINPSASPARTPQPVPSAPISENGPWFVYYHDGEKGLIAANPDGSGRTVLLKDLQSSWIQLAGSPDTHLLAVVTQWTDVPEHDPLNYALLLIRLPGGEIEKVIPLLSYPGIANEQLDAMMYALYWSEPAWSPDGRYLAFMGAINGASIDLYVYEQETGSIRRLTDGKDQAIGIHWSPDSRWIVHGSIRGPVVAGVFENSYWAAPAGGGKVLKLFEPQYGWMRMIGWRSPSAFLAVEANTGLRFIRDFDLSAGKTTLFYDGLVSAPVLDPDSGTVYFSPLDSIPAGVYEASYQRPGPEIVLPGSQPQIWLPGRDVLIATAPQGSKCAGLVAYSPGNELACFDEGIPKVSPDGQLFLAEQDKGGIVNYSLYSIDGRKAWDFPEELSQEEAGEPSWQPGSQGLFFETSLAYYYLTVPGKQLYRLADKPGDPASRLVQIWRSGAQDFFTYNHAQLFHFDPGDGELGLVDEGLDLFTSPYTWVGISP